MTINLTPEMKKRRAKITANMPSRTKDYMQKYSIRNKNMIDAKRRAKAKEYVKLNNADTREWRNTREWLVRHRIDVKTFMATATIELVKQIRNGGFVWDAEHNRLKRV